MKKVLIVGAYGQNNLGDEALLEVFIDQFKDAEITVNSAQPELTAKRYGVKAVGTYVNWPPRFSRIRAVLNADIIVFGGGSLLKEIEGGTVARILYFARILLILLFAQLTGKQTAMLGNGMGPLTQPLFKMLARLAARMTDIICVRDQESHDLLVSIGVTRTIHVTADAVFSLTYSDRNKTAQTPLPELGDFAVVVPRYSLTQNEREKLAQACDHLVETHHLNILLLPFQTNYLNEFDDQVAALDIKGLMRHSESAHIWTTDSAASALDLIGEAQLVLSARLHALIFAAIQTVTPVAINYEVKVGSFMMELGQSSLNVSLADLQANKIPAVLDHALAERSTIHAQLRERTAILREKSLRNFVLLRDATAKQKSLLTGGVVLLISMTIVNAGNYLFNLILGRSLGPKAFADLSLIITLMLMLTFITSTFSLLTARFAAAYEAQGQTKQLAALHKYLGRRGWQIGIITAVLLIISAPVLSQVFQTESALTFFILCIGVPVFFAQSVDRGILQGQTRFGRLALSYQGEMWVRLIGAVLLVAVGFAVNGAVVALSLSFVATWLITRGVTQGLPHSQPNDLSSSERKAILSYIGPISVALISQILINNSDILIVKRYFPSETAGQYAALALIGRIVFFATMSVVTMLFPIVAQKHQKGEAHRHLLYLSLGLVGAVSAVIIGITLVIPNEVVNILFGSAYLGIAPLLWLYGVATAFYALSNVIINYRLSTNDGNGARLAIGGSIAQFIGLLIFHASLEQVVIVQVIVMGAMLVSLLAWDLRLELKSRHRSTQSAVDYPAPDKPVVRGGVS